MPACLRPSSPRQFPEGASGSHTWFSFRSMLAAARVGLTLDGTVRPGPAGRGFGHLLRTDWLPDFRLAAGEMTGTAPMPPIHRGTTKPRSCRPFLNGIRCECRGDGGRHDEISGARPASPPARPRDFPCRVEIEIMALEGIVSIATAGRDRYLTKRERERGGRGDRKRFGFFREHFLHSSGCHCSYRYISSFRIHSQTGPGDCAHVHGQWLGL